MSKGNVTLASALEAAKKISRETPRLIQVHQVSATEFAVFILETPKSNPFGPLVAKFRNGQCCA